MAVDNLGRLIDSPLNRLSELKSDAVSLRTRTTISKNEKLYLDLVLALTETYLSKGAALKKKLVEQGLFNTSILEPAIGELKNHVAHISDLLRLVQKSHPINLPLGTEGLVRDITKRLTPNKLDFFLNVSHSIEYSTAPELLRNLIEKIKANQGKLPDGFDESVNLVVITFFATQSKDILRHSVFAHEIGHVLIRFDASFAKAYNEVVKLVSPKFLEALESFQKTIGQKLTPVQIQQIANIVRSWTEELFVDLVSIHTLGPSAFLAMKEMATEEIDFSSSLSASHPAFYKRIYMMWTALIKMGFGEILRADVKEKGDDYCSYCSEFATFDAAHAAKGIFPHLNDIFDKTLLDGIVCKFIELNLSGAYKATEYKEEVEPLIDLFEEGIAACEIPNLDKKEFKDVSGASILNAAWVIEHNSTLPLDKLNPILNKALANHYMKIQWESFK